MKYKLKYEAAFGDIDQLSAVPTGTWRHKQPLIKKSKCSQCGLCYLYCPAGCVNEEQNGFSIDLRYCKGCGTCAAICPVDAIFMIKEK